MIYLKKIIFAFSLLLSTLSYAQGKQKIIFDCDLGDDIDDAYALAMIISSDKFDVLGVCLDWANTEERAQMATRMLYLAGKENIPVFTGRKTSDKHITQYEWGIGFDKVKPKEKPASEFIVETLNKNPGEVILITVGPVPNMADVVEIDPEALSKAKHIYAMFGSFYMGYGESPVISAEWNVVADVQSSQKYVAHAAGNITFAGLDVTTFVNWDDERMDKIKAKNSPLTNALIDLTSIWRDKTHNHDPILYDCVAVGMVLWPELFKLRKAHVKVTGDGYTVIDESKEPNCMIGMQINKEEFLNRLQDIYLVQKLGR